MNARLFVGLANTNLCCRLVVLLCLCLFVTTGCGKDALEEMGFGSKKEEAPKDTKSAHETPGLEGNAQKVTPPPIPPGSIGAAPATKTPDQILARFLDLQKRPETITDNDLKELTSLPPEKLSGITQLRLSAARKLTGDGVSYLEKLPNLAELEMNSVPVGSTGFQGLAALKHLQRLWLARTRGFDDSAMQYLTGMENLQTLDISGTRVTDVGLSLLKANQNLVELNLSDNTSINGSGFKALRSLKLQWLNVFKTQFGSAGLPHIAAHKSSLVYLNLTQSNLNDQFLQHLKGMNNLEELAMGFNGALTDVGVIKVGGYRSLKKLSLRNLRVTGNSLKWVSKCKELEELDLEGTKVAPLAVQQLHKACKKASIRYNNQLIEPKLK